jgi:adenylate cyclase
MKLRTKISVIFAAALAVYIAVVTFGLTFVLDSLSTRMLEKQAENITLFLQHRTAAGMKDPDHASVLKSVASDFRIATHIADESKGFKVRKILLIRSDFIVETAFPENETGQSYAAHEDIRDVFASKAMETVVETTKNPDGTISKDIDVVSYFTPADGVPMVIEVKLDFAESIALLESQYAEIETGAIVIAIILLTGLLGVLLYIMGHTAIRPVLRVTSAMEDIAGGNMEISLPEGANDEFGILARRFNEMVRGLREKFRLYHYVSKGTIAAVQDSLSNSGEHCAVRKELVLFFSDIRGFTRFSEAIDPATVIDSLNRILSLQAEIIRRHGGDIDKFVGDEVMAVFGDSVSAIDSALEIQAKMAANREIYDRLHVGIGIHRGSVMQGDIGDYDMKDFTVIGDNVNTAARLESIAAADEILISESVAGEPGVEGRYVLSLKGDFSLKGKEVKITTFIVSGKKA